MKKKRISQELQSQIREYLDYIWRENSDFVAAEQNILNQLSDILKDKLMIEANKMILVDCHIFSKHFSEEVISKTVSLIKEYKCTPDEVVFLEGDRDDCSIYFIEKVNNIKLFLISCWMVSLLNYILLLLYLK